MAAGNGTVGDEENLYGDKVQPVAMTPMPLLGKERKEPEEAPVLKRVLGFEELFSLEVSMIYMY
ncbi:hypothetical protein PTKIN_Ptkin02bG0208200 [Pterospermum kingtungense]